MNRHHPLQFPELTKLIDKFVGEGMQRHYPPQVMAAARRLFDRYTKFTMTMSWDTMPAQRRIAWCEVALEAARMAAPDGAAK